MEVQRYQVTQDNKDYIISTSIMNDKIRIECQDKNSPQIFRRDYTLNELISISNIFTYISTLFNVQNELNNSIEREQVQISDMGSIIQILFIIYNKEINFQLYPIQIIQNNEYIQNVQNITSSPQTISQVPIIGQPIYTNTKINLSPSYEDDYPDCTYSTKSPQVYQTTQVIEGCGCPLDQDRITKIELDSNILKAEHDRLIQRLHNFKSNIQFIKEYSENLRKENGYLNMKTLELKKIYKQLLEAEVALMTENDELKRERHELILKKNELDFYIKEHHDHDMVREVNIPIEQKKRRPTNVSKTEKQFGGGYTSNLGKIRSNSKNNNPSNNKTYNYKFYNIKDFY